MPVILDSSEIKVIDGDKNFTIETVKSNVIVNQDTEINKPVVPILQLETTVSSETIDETYKYMAFTHSGGSEDQTEYSVKFNIETECDILIVGGGGAGGNNHGGGGGGGAVIYCQNKEIPNGNYTIKVGNGGNTNRENGQPTEAFNVIADGGGGGGYYNGVAGNHGGCGGGAPYNSSSSGNRIYTDNSSNDLFSSWGGTNNIYGGDGNNGSVASGGGGGGAGGSSTSVKTNGNDGIQINIDGNNYYWAGGGGGYSEASSGSPFGGNGGLGGGGGAGHYNNPEVNDGVGGTGGINLGGDGGEDGHNANTIGGNGGDHTGSGGGAGHSGHFGSGGSGIVIIRYKVIDLVMEPQTLTHYTPERMYPPTRDLASASHLISGESYGNGVYETSESDKYGTTLHGYSAFNTSMDTGPHFNNKYTNGVYNGSDYIVPGYLGDWIKIKLPRPIKLTKYGFKQRLNYLIRAPGKYKLYGSNDGTNWDVLVHKITTVSYTQQISFANDYFEENINVNNQYQYFGLVANQLYGNEQYFNFDEWYIYGKEFISEDPEYKTLTFEHEAVEDLVYDFTDKNSLSTWVNYANSLPGGSTNVSGYYQDGVYIGGDPVGYFQLELPTNYDSVEITFSNTWNEGLVNLYIDTLANIDTSTAKLSLLGGQSDTRIWNYTTGQYLKINETVNGEEGGSIIGANLKLTFKKSQTEYTVNFTEDTECDILIVGGGGGGGGVEEPATSGSGGGGGGGGVIFLQNQTISTGSYIIKVGKGGKGYDIADSTRQTGERGYNSSFNYIQTEAIGGGGGGTRGISFLSQGLEGGSGGGSSHTNGSTDTPGGLGTVVNLLKADGTVLIENYRQGYNGGTTVYESPYSGGGGGAGGNGFGSADTPDDSAGGIGRAEENGVDFKTYFNIASGIGEHHTDSKVYFAGGGASGYRSNDANHSNGGLGGGGSSSNGPSENGVANTGGGGGGARSGSAGTIQTGGNGGSGIVIIRYKTQYQATTHGAQWTYHSANPNTHHYGNVGIGTVASATQKLLVNGDMNVTGNYKQNDNTIGNWYKGGTSIYRASGNVGIGNTDPRYSLHVHGGVYAGEGGTTGDGTTVWTSTSDSRMKDNIFKASYKECYDIFKKIELYRYNFKPGHVNSNDRNQLGFIAQEVQQQIPNSVEPRSIRLSSGVYIHDILTLNVTQINYILYGTFKYLIAELDIIKKHLESQEEAGQTE